MNKYEFEDGMAEISGFGGSYEAACRKMIETGLNWFDEHPNADPQFVAYTGIYGIIDAANEDAKELSKVVLESVDDCTGAMYQATISHIMHIHKVGWETYVREMKAMSRLSEKRSIMIL